MAGGKKKKSSSAKKNKKPSSSAKTPKKSIPLEDVLAKAESAMEMSEVDTALQLFTYAAGILRPRVHGDANASSNINSGSIDHDKKTLATVLGKVGELKASNGDAEGARTDFLDAIELLGSQNSTENDQSEDNIATAQNCESRASLQLYLGQLSCSDEALESFRVGVKELERAVGILERLCEAGTIQNTMDVEGGGVEMSSGDLKLFLVETRRQLCAAHCTIAELYLTDLCDEPNAETLCEAALQSALELDKVSSVANDEDMSPDIDRENSNSMGPPPPDALQTMANLRLSQSRVPEALEYILKAYDRMRVGCEAMAALVGLGRDTGIKEEGEIQTKAQELVEVDAASSIPGFEFRCQTAKIMLECASLVGGEQNGNATDTAKQCAESAIQVLGSLMAENDEVIEVWYLLGCAFMACSPPNPESAKYYWETAMTMLNRVKEDLENTLDDDDDGYKENELEGIEMQIIEVKKKLGDYKEDDEDEGDEMDDF